jgi:hypothetical protein
MNLPSKSPERPFVPRTSPPLAALTRHALEARLSKLYDRHPVQSTLDRFRACFPGSGPTGVDCLGFESAEGIYRAGAQGLRLSQVPQLPESVAQLSRLSVVEQAGRKAIRASIESDGTFHDEGEFLARWDGQGKIGGAEHQVYFDESSGRWHKRLYRCVLGSTLGDYLDRMLLHGAVFPETAYRLEGFTLNARNRDIAPLVSQPHVSVAMDQPPVSREETRALMAAIGFEPVQLRHDGIIDDGYFAFYHPECGILAHDLHDENVVRMQETGELAVIDPYLSLARKGTWAAIKLAEIGIQTPPDDPLP